MLVDKEQEDCVKTLINKHKQDPSPPIKKIMEDCGVEPEDSITALSGIYHSAETEPERDIAKRVGAKLLIKRKEERKLSEFADLIKGHIEDAK